jgi:TPP-dependent indolepyruvate ferredoxin oxidoreductase alpha subunit
MRTRRPGDSAAIARRACAYGARVVTGYPGTAGTAFLKTGARHDGIDPEWATNEREGD